MKKRRADLKTPVQPAKERRPTVYVIAGPNGAGKTTFATTFLPDFVHCREFLNADLIAAGLSPFAPETQNVRAGRLLLTRMRELTEARADFGFETTLAGRSYVRHFEEWRARRFRIVLFFLWLPNVELAIARVRKRVRQGGHHVADADIHRRYSAGLTNFWNEYRRTVDRWQLLDASENAPRLVTEENDGTFHVFEPVAFAAFRQTVER